jgi:hypothetical protein
LFEVLTGVRLYEAGPEPDYRALAKKVAKGEHALPSEVDPTLALYDDLVATALCPKVEDRYQSAAEFRDAIQQALVSVNPTISTDQLGSYMRDLFADEMTAQRELHERVAKTHIADFQEQFHTQTISTISFAVAQLPLQPPVLGNPRRSAAHKSIPPTPLGKSGAHDAIRPSPAHDTMAPATSTMLPHDDLGLADGTGTSAREHAQRRRLPLIIGGAVVVVLLGIVGFAMTRGDDKKPAQIATTDPKDSHVTIEPIEEPLPPPDKKALVPEDPAVEIEKPAEPPRPRDKDKKSARDKKDKPPDVKKVERAPDDQAKKPEGISRDSVTNEWLAARREYASYKNKNGTTLEKEYTDLVVYVQYNVSKEANLPETLARIQGFRRKIRE